MEPTKIFWGTSQKNRGDPPPPRVDPPPHPLFFFFFSLTPHTPKCDMGYFFLDPTPHHTLPHARHGPFFPNVLQIWQQKGPLGPFWRSNLCPGRHRHPGGALLAPLRGPPPQKSSVVYPTDPTDQELPKYSQCSTTRGQTRTLDSSQRDVPVYVVFLQGVLTVPVGCLCQWAVCASGLSGQVRPFRRVYSGASAPAGPRRGARDAPPGCRCLPGHKFDHQKGPKV